MMPSEKKKFKVSICSRIYKSNQLVNLTANAYESYSEGAITAQECIHKMVELSQKIGRLNTEIIEKLRSL